MILRVEDRLAIHELIALHGHLMDHGELQRLDELFTRDVVYDLRDFGRGELRGIDAIADAALALGDGNPLGHHVTNIVITDVSDDEVRVLSKGIGIRADGTSGTLVYEDVVRRVDAGWRIARRRVVLRREPLRP
ncbi:MAG TPA: nuclear transport factor 2 family protein [Gemmatimonadaceae bacterium]|nr:nuclear transport factor 2 family protein [Gemmatimonadaceae bacterium]